MARHLYHMFYFYYCCNIFILLGRCDPRFPLVDVLFLNCISFLVLIFSSWFIRNVDHRGVNAVTLWVIQFIKWQRFHLARQITCEKYFSPDQANDNKIILRNLYIFILILFKQVRISQKL